jgi:hypothetical protein
MRNEKLKKRQDEMEQRVKVLQLWKILNETFVRKEKWSLEYDKYEKAGMIMISELIKKDEAK